MSREMQVVLSLMPGIDLLGMAFKAEGFCVVQGGDVIFGGDVRTEHYPAGKFDGLISGPPCQTWSPLANLCRARGIAVAPDLIPEFQRCVAEADPQWFLMENVPRAPQPVVPGFGVHSFVLDNRQCVEADGKPATQRRLRRWSFGWQGGRKVLGIDTVAIGNPHITPTVTANGTKWETRKNRKGQPKSYRSQGDFRVYCKQQGLPDDFDLPLFTVAGKIKAVGNGVPIAMGRAMAAAVKETLEGVEA